MTHSVLIQKNIFHLKATLGKLQHYKFSNYECRKYQQAKI